MKPKGSGIEASSFQEDTQYLVNAKLGRFKLFNLVGVLKSIGSINSLVNHKFQHNQITKDLACKVACKEDNTKITYSYFYFHKGT